MIDYKILQQSVEFYEEYGFKRIEAPWTVTKAISDITKPAHCPDFTILEKNKVLVASGEQSFLYLYNKGFLPKGRFQTITPCFRDDTFDLIHTKYFMKNELIDTEDVSEDKMIEMIDIAKTYFKIIFPISDDIIVKRTGVLSHDIYYKDIELGSYGIRQHEFLTWIYGTGCAEPRTSYCLNLANK